MQLTNRSENNLIFFHFSVARINNPSIFAASFDGRDTLHKAFNKRI